MVSVHMEQGLEADEVLDALHPVKMFRSNWDVASALIREIISEEDVHE